jgi:hypothetical protein
MPPQDTRTGVKGVGAALRRTASATTLARRPLGATQNCAPRTVDRTPTAGGPEGGASQKTLWGYGPTVQPLPQRCAHADRTRPIDCWKCRQICDHAVLIERCEVCAPLLSRVEDVPRLVWVSTTGNAFHGTSMCDAITAGQDRQRARGLRARGALTVGIADAAGLKRSPCVVCLEGVAWPPQFSRSPGATPRSA